MSIGMRPNSIITVWGWDPIQWLYYGDETQFNDYIMGLRPNSIITLWEWDPIHLLQYGNKTQFNYYICSMLIKILSIGITKKEIMLRSIIIHAHQYNIPGTYSKRNTCADGDMASCPSVSFPTVDRQRRH